VNKKQILGLVVAALVFVFVSAMGVLTRQYAEKIFSPAELLSADLPDYPSMGNYVGVIPIEGTIADSAAATVFTDVAYDHQKVLNSIDEMANANNNKGILLRINSPGGTVSASDELYLKLKAYREKTDRPVYVYAEDMACSGALYIAMASGNKIYANRNAWIGSIGVIISMMNYKELYDKLGIKEINITSGENKALGTPGEELTEDQREVLQALVDSAYEQFVGIVATGRDMTPAQARALADGSIWGAKRAYENGLVDGVLSYEETLSLIREDLGKDLEIFEPERKTTLFQSFFSAIGSVRPKSDAQILQEMQQGSGVLQYYANLP